MFERFRRPTFWRRPKCVQSLHSPVMHDFTSRLAKQNADLPDTVPSACDGGKECFAAFAQATRL